MSSRNEIEEFMKSLQDDICIGLENLDGKTFRQDLWQRAEGGGGRTRILEGNHIEKGGVNFSAVHGPMPAKISKALNLSEGQFFATGVSIVLHPKNPFVPIIHMNVRYFEMDSGMYWFGGGIDLTPHYINMQEAKRFHQHLKTCCDLTDESFYPEFKKWADDYFYLKHRNETRGIGGIFFDRLNEQSRNISKEKLFGFVKNVGHTFLKCYLPLIENNMNKTYTKQHKDWQYHRRGRYVEFNLVWDKGTKFGLDTNGRTESILMSLPPRAHWTYEHEVQEGSDEAFTLSQLKKGVDYISL